MGGRSYSRCSVGDCRSLDDGKCSADPVVCPVERHRRETLKKSKAAVKSKARKVKK